MPNLFNVHIQHLQRKIILGSLVVASVLSLSCAQSGLANTQAGLPAGAQSTKPPSNAVGVDENVKPASPPVSAIAQWQRVDWNDLPGWELDDLQNLWNAWLASCSRAAQLHKTLAAMCPDIRRLSIADTHAQRQWLQTHWQAWRIEPATDSKVQGLLTGYYEPVLEARRQRQAGFETPLHAMPAALLMYQKDNKNVPWFSRKELDTLPEAQGALVGHELAFVNSPLDALVVHIQGSATVRLPEADGTHSLLRLAFAGHNAHAYRSVGTWLASQGQRNLTWPAIAAWANANPQRLQEMLWQNPRVVFFKPEPLDSSSLGTGPKGAQGVPLTAGRSIAIDPQVMPYGSPVWLTSDGPTLQLQRLVLAQDTGTAIRGAVRADYFVGQGPEAGDVAGRLKQNLRLWLLWPKTSTH